MYAALLHFLETKENIQDIKLLKRFLQQLIITPNSKIWILEFSIA